MIPATFHFLRPAWLLALFPAVLIVALAARRMTRAGAGGWAGLVDAHLLRHLAVPGAARRGSRLWLAALAAGLLAAVLAMAGPTWQHLPVPVESGAEPTVIVLSLAQSMNGTDLVPSRLTRAGQKLRDMLAREKGDDVALVIYADRPFVAAPLTSDAAVIRQMLPELSTTLMPVLGNRLDRAITEAQGLLTRGGAGAGRIVVIAADAGNDPAASISAAAAVRKAGYTLSVLGVGTDAGAKVQTADGRVITGTDGAPVISRLDTAALTKVASAGGGKFTTLTAGNRDIRTLLPADTTQGAAGKVSDIVTDRWHDMGYFLLILPVVLAPFAFRRGLLFALALAFCGLGMAPTGARADGWRDLVQTPDQQGQSAFDSGDFAAAAQAFDSPAHKAAALYRAGKFDAAAQLYASLPPPRSAGIDYDTGNAFARAGKLKEALSAYDAALAKNPGDADAKFNRDLVAKLLEQQKQQQKKKQDQKTDQQKADQQKSSQQNGKGEGQNQPGKPNAQTGEKAQADAKGQAKDQKREPQDGAAESAQHQPDQGTPQQAAPKPGAQPVDQPGKTPKPGDMGEQMDRALAATGQPDAEAKKGALPALDQSAEQQLRAVPDDPSGLLRARIYQYYARLRAAGQ